MRVRDLILDQYAPLSYKRPLRDGRGLGRHEWLPEDHRRRLAAYQLLRAYVDNVARAFLTVGDDDPGAADHREYGDPALLVAQARSAILGDRQTIVVDGADRLDSAYDPDSDDATPEQTAEQQDAQARTERQQWLRAWADAERLPAKLVEGEQHAVALGDAVYLLAWSAGKQRPRLRVVDPGFYFPVLRDGLDADEYPERVHLAWEVPGDPVAGIPGRLRRITYELGPIEPARDPATGPVGRVRRALRLGEDGQAVLQPGDARDGQGRIVRRYPWQAEDDRPSTTTCYLTDAEWTLDDVRGQNIDTLDPDRATYALNEDGELLDRLDLRVDFLPIVHVPNTVAGAEHYGRSVLSSVLQLLDDLASSDTDAQAASSTTGSPPIGLTGARMPSDTGDTVRIGPGEVWELGENGGLTTVDTSGSLAALRATVDALADRLSVNARMPAALLGRVKPSEVPSGLALALSFGPLERLVGEARLVRGEKYPLLLRMVQRLAQAGGVLPAGPPPRAELQLGSFLPADVDAVIGRAAKLYEARIVSLETAVRMIVEAGVPVEDVAEEVERITRRDYDAANRLADATGDQDAVRELLGLPDSPATTVVPALLNPAPLLPPAP